MLDGCSQGTFLDEKLLDEEQLLGRKTTITVKTLNGEATKLTKVVEGLKVANGGKKFHQKERWIYARKDLAVESDVAKPSQIAKWKYLEQIKDELKLNPNVKTGFLIGANCSRALGPEMVIHSEGDGPYAFRTILGWCIVGPISKKNATGGKMSCNRTAMIEAGTSNLERHQFETKSQVQENDIKQWSGGCTKQIFENQK